MRGEPEGRVSRVIFLNLPPPTSAALFPSPVHGGFLFPNGAPDGPQVLQEPLEVDVIQHVLPHEVDQVHLEMLELQRQVAELEKHLGTARQGGREPPSRWQLHGPNRVALGGQVGALCWPHIRPGCWPSGVLLQRVPCVPSAW